VKDIAPDPGSLPREYGGSSAGTGVFVRSGRYWERRTGQKRRQPTRDTFSLCYLSRRAGYPHVNSSLTEESVSVNTPSLVQPVGCRPVMSTGLGIALVAAGAILRFAVPATFIPGLNLRVVGVIVMLAGVIALLLSLLVWGPLSRRRNHSGGYGSGTPPLARQRSVYRDQPPARRPSPP